MSKLQGITKLAKEKAPQ